MVKKVLILDMMSLTRMVVNMLVNINNQLVEIFSRIAKEKENRQTVELVGQILQTASIIDKELSCWRIPKDCSQRYAVMYPKEK